MLHLFWVMLLMGCTKTSNVVTPIHIPEIDNLTPSLANKTVPDWCSKLEDVIGIYTDTAFRNSHIVYDRTYIDADKLYDQIWKISWDDGSEVMLHDHVSSPLLGLAFLPDGSHYIAVRSRDVMRSDLKGSAWENMKDVNNLSGNFLPYSPLWNLLSSSPETADFRHGIFHSPNGVYSATWNPGDHALIMLNKTTGTKNEIIKTEAPDIITGANWSPDGSSFVFVFYKNSNPYYSQVYIVKPDGNNLKPLSGPFEMEVLYRPIWSPDGQKIAIPLLGKDGWYYIAIINRVTDVIKRFRVSPVIRMDSIQDQGEMVWSPDSRWFAYISQYGHYGVEVLNTDNGKIFCGQDDEKFSVNILDWR